MQVIKTKSFEIAASIVGIPNSSRVALLMPGRLDTKDYVNFVSHSEHLAKKGFLTIAFDLPGTWDSPGDLADYTTSMYLQVVDELIDCMGGKSTLLLGHSRGGATAMLASINSAVAGLVLVNASYKTPSAPKPEEVVDGFVKEYRDLPPGNVQTKEKRSFDLPMSYFEDGARYDPVTALKKYKGPKLLVHATNDEFVTLKQAKEIYESLSEPKQFLEIDCNHDYRLFPEAIQSVNNALDEFIERYLVD